MGGEGEITKKRNNQQIATGRRRVLFPPLSLPLSRSHSLSLCCPFDVLFDCHFIYLLNKANLSSNTKGGLPEGGQGSGPHSGRGKERIAIAIPIVNATKKIYKNTNVNANTGEQMS